MGRIVRDSVQTYEVVDGGRGLVKEVDFGTNAVSDIITYAPAVGNLVMRAQSVLHKIVLNLARKLRDKLAPDEELETLHKQDAEVVLNCKESGLIGAFKNLSYAVKAKHNVYKQIFKYLKIKIVKAREEN